MWQFFIFHSSPITTTETVPYTDLCKPNENTGIMVINQRVQYDEFYQLCADFEGELPIPTSIAQAEAEQETHRLALEVSQD